MKTLFLIVVAALLAGCTHMRDHAAAGCVLPAYKLLPGSIHPALHNLQTGEGDFSSNLRASLSGRRQLMLVAGASPRSEVLMLSGGSQHGAFGAGFFLGLASNPATPHHKIPDYDVVTAVSTGALMSTPIFLANRTVPGDRDYPAWMKADPKLGQTKRSNLEDLAIAFAISREGDLLQPRKLGYAAAVTSGSLASFKPLRDLMNLLITDKTMSDVAREAKNRRSLYVGVTNLDDGFGYAINLTELAATAEDEKNIPAARQCYIDALIASSSVPPGVPPMTLRTVNPPLSVPHDDLYIDGGARFGIFFDQLRKVASATGPTDVTIVINGKLYSDPWHRKDGSPVGKWSVLNVGFRAIDLLENQVYRLSIDDQEQWAVRNGTLRVALISNEGLKVRTEDPDLWKYDPAGVPGTTCAAASREDDKHSPLQFHPLYMRCLIDYGQARGQEDPWNRVLP